MASCVMEMEDLCSQHHACKRKTQSMHSFSHAWPDFNILTSCSISFILNISHTITHTRGFGFRSSKSITTPTIPAAARRWWAGFWTSWQQGRVSVQPALLRLPFASRRWWWSWRILHLRAGQLAGVSSPGLGSGPERPEEPVRTPPRVEEAGEDRVSAGLIGNRWAGWRWRCCQRDDGAGSSWLWMRM